MIDAGREDPFSLRYHLSNGKIVDIELSAKKFLESFLRLTMENQLVFWENVVTELHTPGVMGKLVNDGRNEVTIIRLGDSNDGTVNLRVSP
jgi:hypothetical protein